MTPPRTATRVVYDAGVAVVPAVKGILRRRPVPAIAQAAGSVLRGSDGSVAAWRRPSPRRARLSPPALGCRHHARRPRPGASARVYVNFDVDSAGPVPGGTAHPGGPGPIDGRLDDREDGTLDGGRDENLAPAPVLVGSVGGVVVPPGELPDLLEDEPRDKPGPGAEQDPDRLVGESRHPPAHECRPRTIATTRTVAPLDMRHAVSAAAPVRTANPARASTGPATAAPARAATAAAT